MFEHNTHGIVHVAVERTESQSSRSKLYSSEVNSRDQSLLYCLAFLYGLEILQAFVFICCITSKGVLNRVLNLEDIWGYKPCSARGKTPEFSLLKGF